MIDVSMLSIELERLDASHLLLSHLPGAWNKLADFLSRRAAPGAKSDDVWPLSLEGVKRRTLAARSAPFWRLPTPAARPDLWAVASDSSYTELWTSAPGIFS